MPRLLGHRRWVVWLLLVAAASGGCAKSPAGRQAQASARNVGSEPPDDPEFCRKLDEVVDLTGNRYMDVDQNAAWQIVHGILAYGPALKVHAKGQLVGALDYLLGGGQLNGWDMRPGSQPGWVETVVAPGSNSGQGHEDQWVGYLSQVGLTPDTELTVAGRTFKVSGLLEQAKWDIYEGMEATWTLMALATFLPLDSTWTARDGQQWTIERIIEMEAQQDLGTSACGGTHRLYAITIALNRYLAEGGELTGGWAVAEQKLQDALDKVRKFQLPDGALSAMYFERPSDSADVENRMRTTGHTLEVLTVALNDEQLREPWVRRAAWRLCEMFEQTRELPIECGALYHAARGLMLYRYRIFGPRETSPAAADPAPSSQQPAPLEDAPEAVSAAGAVNRQ